MQTGVAVGTDNKVTGSLKYIADYTAAGFDMSKGNHFLALHFTGTEGSTLQVKSDNEGSTWVTLDEDGIVVTQIAETTTKISVKETLGEETTTKDYTLDLTLQPQG